MSTTDDAIPDDRTANEPIILPVAPEPDESHPAGVELVIPAAVSETIATFDDSFVAIPFPAEPTFDPFPLEDSDLDESPLVLDEIRALGQAIDRRLSQLQTSFDREVRAEATREKVVDRLHAELQEYKQDLLLNTLRPVFVDLIQLHDDVGKMVAARPGSDSETAQEPQGEVGRLLGLLAGVQLGIEDILYRQGVEPYSLPGETFDPRKQRAVATAPTDDPALNKAVAIHLRKGFQAGDKIIRPEVVSVYALRK